ncbi:MAG: tetratricopeptide repeat protein [Cyanobacteria bacterium RUI128]|nr:tetratricopeptide repeat protein [Cyanobacteria bacterium RUI128]
MKKAIFIVTILFVAVISTACINNMAVQELNNAAKSYMEKGDYTSAIERLEASLDLDNNVYETHYNLGVAYINAKQYPKAIGELNRALSINSKYANTYYSLAVAQENNADSLLGCDEVASTNEDGNVVSDVPAAEIYKNASPDVKEKMIEGYLTSIANYRKYIEMINSEQKTVEVNAHISDMEKVLVKLGYTGSAY